MHEHDKGIIDDTKVTRIGEVNLNPFLQKSKLGGCYPSNKLGYYIVWQQSFLFQTRCEFIPILNLKIIELLRRKGIQGYYRPICAPSPFDPDRYRVFGEPS